MTSENSNWDELSGMKLKDNTHRYFECEIFFLIFNDHDKKWELDSKGLLCFSRTGYICCAVKRCKK